MGEKIRAYNHLVNRTQDIDHVRDSKFLDFEPKAEVSEALGTV